MSSLGFFFNICPLSLVADFTRKEYAHPTRDASSGCLWTPSNQTSFFQGRHPLANRGRRANKGSPHRISLVIFSIITRRVVPIGVFQQIKVKPHLSFPKVRKQT